ncbi:hypothetical protein G7054_g9913 [Neopestalotiopsis clavispora]|nr:hypothetical protein G7054_g9913 [Neopestalotiopsis clavispora]
MASRVTIRQRLEHHSRRRAPIFRVRTGCLTCRTRKKKCDEVKPICAGCSRNHLTCKWPSHPNPPRSQHDHNGSGKRSGPHTTSSPAGQSASEQNRPTNHEPLMADGNVSPLDPSTEGLDESQLQRVSAVEMPECVLPEIEARDLSQLIPTCTTSYAHSATHNMDSGAISGFEQMPSALSLLPGLQARSLDLLSHYTSHTALSMGNGSTDNNPFITQMVPLMFVNKLVLQLVLTQSSAHRAIAKGIAAEAAQRDYAESLRTFQYAINEYISGQQINPLWITVGALIMCFTETTRGDVHGAIFDHLSASGPLLSKFIDGTAVSVHAGLRDFIVEYYVYTGLMSMISIDPIFSTKPLIEPNILLEAQMLASSGYTGQLHSAFYANSVPQHA